MRCPVQTAPVAKAGKGAWTLAPCDLKRGERLVLSRVGVELPVGTMTALVGPNGAGKSTLLLALAGLIDDFVALQMPDGRVVNGLERAKRAQISAWGGAESSFAFAFDVLSVVLMGRFPWHGGHPGARDRERALQALAALDAGQLAKRSVTALSSGERQKVAIARVLASDAKLLLLDEPTSNLDLDAGLRLLRELRRRVDEEEATVVVGMHDLAAAFRYFDRVVCLDQGGVAAAGTPAVTLTPELIRRCFGVEAELLRDAAGSLRLSLGP